MKIQTKYHGEIEVAEDQILNFENGIPGFLDEKRFVVLPLTEDGIYHLLQSVDTAGLAFVITNPFLFFKNYEFDLEDSVIDQLGIKTPEDVQIYNILTLQDPFEKTTINLQAPVVINVKNNKAKQVILNNESYKTKHLLFHNTDVGVKG